MKVSTCDRCDARMYWFDSRPIDPAGMTGPPPNPDMPEDPKQDYQEARSVLDLSPRSACGLLRLVVQKLCVELGEPGKTINADIGALVDKGLSPEIQRALDLVRVVGNNALHPGQMDLRDDRDTALSLFELVNFIVQDRISQPKRIEEMYLRLPESARSQIERRDGPKSLPAAGET